VRRICAAACLTLTVIACGGGSLTMTEYAAESEVIAADVIGRIAAADAAWESQPPTPERAKAYWEARLAARHDFMDAVHALDPPGEFADFHNAAVEVYGKVTAAEEALAARSAEYETFTDHGQWWDTPEGRAARALDDEGIAICQAAQAEFDATAQRDEFSDAPWIPPELKEVVRAALGCPE